jgi:hypothetical protein
MNETNIVKLLCFTGSALSDKPQTIEVTMAYAGKNIKVILAHPEVVLLVEALATVARAEAEAALATTK